MTSVHLPAKSTLQRRFLLVATLLVVFVAGLGGTFLYRNEYVMEEHSLASRASFTAKFLAEALSQPLWNLDDQTIRSYLDASMLDQQLHAITIYSPDSKQVLYQRGRDDNSLQDEIIVNEVIVYDERGETLGHVEVVFTRAYLYQMMARLRTFYGVIVLLIILVLVIGISLMLRRMVINPLQEMTAVMDEIAQGNCSLTIRTHADDEVGLLADAFRRMGGYLQTMAAAADRIARLEFDDTFQPVSERDTLGNAFRQMTENLRLMIADIQKSHRQMEASNRDLQAFNYSVSHDLQAPIRVINGFSRILLEDYASQIPEEARKYITRIFASSQKMGGMINGLLDLSRLGQASVHKEFLSGEELEAMIREIAAEVSSAEPQRNVLFQIDPLQPCHADTILLRQVWVNLILNAFKYTSTKEEGVIRIGSLDQSEASAYYIQDNGVGFDMAQYDRLFLEFQRLHRDELFEGSGVGLATVKRIIEIHGGKIWAVAELDKGATFSFEIPLQV